MPDGKPLVSVVIPTYNAPALLLETLGTVFAQTLTDYEVIVINDGSTDDTLARLEPMQKLHADKLRIVTQANAGIGAARNRGLELATGKYVAFLDHDDLWMPRKLEEQVAFMRKHPQCVACGTLYAFSTAPQRPRFEFSHVADSQGIVKRPLWHSAQGAGVLQTCTLMVDRARIQGITYANERHSVEDAPFHVKLLGRGEYGIAGREILAIYRIFEGNNSRNPLFYYGGIKQLRRMDKNGEFDAIPPNQRADLEAYFSQLGRVAAMGQLMVGKRRAGIEIYCREFFSNVRQGRWRFLLMYPALTALPPGLILRSVDRRLRRVAGRRA